MKFKLFSFKNSRKNKFKYIFFAVFSLLIITTVNLSLKTEKVYANDTMPQSCTDLSNPEKILINNYGYKYLSSNYYPKINQGEKGGEFLNFFKNNLKCLYELSLLTGNGKDIVSTFEPDGLDKDDLEYDSFKEALINYEEANGLIPDGVIDVQTSFLMGYHLGKGFSTISTAGDNKCNSGNDKVSFGNEKFINSKSSNIEIENLNKSATCALNMTSFDTYDDIINNLDETYKKLLNGKDAGISFMYVLGYKFGLEKGKWETPPFTYEEEASCNSLEFTNENLFLINNDYASRLNFPRDENVKTASRILLCLNNFHNKIGISNTFLDDSGAPTISTTVYADIRDYVYAYQKADENKNIFQNIPISLGNGLGSGSGVLDIKTAFVMGTQIGKLNKDLEHQSCKDEVINFDYAHTISKDGKGYNYLGIKDRLIESKFNSYHLQNVIACLREPVFNNKNIPVSFFKNPIDNFWNHNLRLEKYLPKNTGGTKRVGIPLIFHLGKLFGRYGGKVIDDNSNNIKSSIDYCAKYKSISSLIDRMHSNKEITLTPRNPGVIDWRDIKELDIPEECLTDTKLAASLIGKIIRFAELFVGLIAVLMFIYGGFLYITAHGEEQNASKGLKSIYTGVIGIFIILMSRFIVEIIIPISEKGIGLDRSKAFTSDVVGNQQIVELTNWLLGFSSFIAISSLIYGGYIWLISGGDENLHTKAVTILRNTLIGFVIIFSAYTIVMVVLGGAGITN